MFLITVVYVGLEEGKCRERSSVCFKYFTSVTSCEHYSFPFHFSKLICYCWESTNVLVQVQVVGRIITNFLQKIRQLTQFCSLHLPPPFQMCVHILLWQLEERNEGPVVSCPHSLNRYCPKVSWHRFRSVGESALPFKVSHIWGELALIKSSLWKSKKLRQSDSVKMII